MQHPREELGRWVGDLLSSHRIFTSRRQRARGIVLELQSSREERFTFDEHGLNFDWLAALRD
jgi:hypothetical protein